ncbi:MAG: terpene utilization protein AtuA [Alphaproteobacteria bacterium HGW-Alphaproteobacteria-2]|nr:MAG: terpene utilization protein AtuA [Alphaproteobacteria bacterium HGW-Alphaproteobacteria-2]
MDRVFRIGCGAGFWGDSPEGPAQLVASGGIDVLVMDYLAEITMSILARMKAKDPTQGYATDFVSLVMRPLARQIADRRIRVVTNAGGLNPAACRDALVALFDELGLPLKVALVAGDDLSDRVDALRAAGAREMVSGAPLPGRLVSVNAYLGAFPIAAALDRGADVVVTGRCVDSALVLGPLIHAFGWGPDDHDRLSAGSLAGHIIECGTQCTGGVFTDWRDVPGWDDMGFPVAHCRADGTFEITKPAGTGGLVTPATIAEQIVYEVGDPGSYLLPDVTCDWRGVRLEQTGPDRVRVTGARGRAPTDSCKVSATWSDGWRSSVTMMIAGGEAAARAEATGAAILKRTARLIAAAGHEPFTETSVEVLGAEASYGVASCARAAREVILKIAVRHPGREALEIFGREIFPAATAMAQGLTGFAGGRPKAQPVVRLFSFLTPKVGLSPMVEDAAGRLQVPFAPPAVASATAPPMPEPPAPPEGPRARVPLIALAHGRSGDKGNSANIGILARDPALLPVIRAALTPAAVAAAFAHYAPSRVDRFDWPGLAGVNFLLHEVLGGGGIASLRHDPQGKVLAQVLLDTEIDVPGDWLAPGGPLAGRQDRSAA